MRPLDPAALQYGCSKSAACCASVLEIEVLFECKQAYAEIHTLAKADQGLHVHAAGGCVLCPTVGVAVGVAMRAAYGCVAHGWPSGLPDFRICTFTEPRAWSADMIRSVTYL